MTERREPPGEDAIRTRMRWLLDNRYQGNRTVMAKAVRVSLTGLIKVVSGHQTPGRRFIEKLVQHTGVRPAWLLTGEGQPFDASVIPVAATCLSGPPSEAAARLIAGGAPAVPELYSPSRYWLELGRTEPAVKTGGDMLVAGDLMLMETDRSKFPPAEHLAERWAVVLDPSTGGKVARLAKLSYLNEGEDHAPAHLEAETYTHHPVRVRRLEVDELPDGTFEVTRRAILRDTPTGTTSRTWNRRREGPCVSPYPVSVDEVVAVCLLLVRRFDRSRAMEV